MATICTTCEGYGKYYLHHTLIKKDCETCNTTGLTEPPEEAEDMSAKLKEWHTVLERELTRIARYRDDIEWSISYLEELADNLVEEVLG